MTAVAPVPGGQGQSLFVTGVDFLDDGFFRNYQGVDRDMAGMVNDLEFLNSTDRILLSERFAKDSQCAQ